MAKSILLQQNMSADVTVICNEFIDRYMPLANGEYVKVYLYLLRCLNGNIAISFSDIADKFEHTEKDVNRALLYWEKLHLLSLEYDSSKNLVAVRFLDFPNTASGEPISQTASREPISQTASLQSEASPSYSARQISQLKEKEEIRQILFIAENYLAKTLTRTEVETLLYFYDQLHFSVDLIEYLIEYCVSREKKSIYFMKSIAFSWAKENITTVEQAKEANLIYDKYSSAVMKAFGIKGRLPGESEIAFIKKWSKEYAFTTDIIAEACNRTIQSIHQPSFEYADSILTKWHKSQVRHMSDISALDARFQKNKNTAAPVQKNVQTTKFNNFQQNTYNFQELEKELLSNL